MKISFNYTHRKEKLKMRDSSEIKWRKMLKSPAFPRFSEEKMTPAISHASPQEFQKRSQQYLTLCSKLARYQT